MRPAYLDLHEKGELAARIERARAMLADCRLCPRACGVDRLAGDTGVCGIGAKSVVASYTLHYGEEDPLVGSGGSGTIFFAGCNLRCVFCQNYEISHHPEAGLPATDEELAGVMLELARQGAENINLVSPTHVVPQILAALPIAIEHGLSLPLVYNTGGYDSLETLELLRGVVDIYMPDYKTADTKAAKMMLGAPDYPLVAKRAIAEMHAQVGDLVINDDGVAEQGLLVRHLVLPKGLADTARVMADLAALSTDMYVNVMAQYRPMHRAKDFAGLDRPPTSGEYASAVELARKAGLHRLDGPLEERLWQRLIRSE